MKKVKFDSIVLVMPNLLIITQKVDFNDDVLGFFHEWIREFAKKCGKVTVICLKLGQYELSGNVKILSLGKEQYGAAVSDSNIVAKIKYLWRFYKYIWQERDNYNAVFAHMNPQYIPLGWPVWKLLGKKMSLWYAHGHVPPMLKIADSLTNLAFASTPEGYRLNSKKLKIVGQGIDVNKFRPSEHKSPDGSFKIVSIGRISPSKDYETLIRAVEIISPHHKLQVEIAGSPTNPSDADYLRKLNQLLVEKKLDKIIRFIGPVPNKDIVPILQSADLFVNMGHTGSLDKANLEAMACGLPVLTCNEAYENVLGKYREILMYPKKDFLVLAQKINMIISLDQQEREKMSNYLRQIVVRDHNLEGLINKITSILFGHNQ